MDGDAGHPVSPRPNADYRVRVDYELPPGPVEAQPRGIAKPQTDKAAEPPPAPARSRGKRLLYWSVGALVVAALVVAGVLYWLHARQFESTDDAFIDGHIAQVSSRIAGRVDRIAVEDYQHVTAGQLLVALDPRDLQVKLDQAIAQRAQAAAQVQQAEAGLLNQQASVDQASANLRVAQADASKAQTDFGRYRAVNPQAISREQFDTASTTARSAQARVDAAAQTVAAANAGVTMQQAQIEAARANLQAADVAVANARLQLSYTEITAPRDGQVAKRTVELGNYVNPGQALLAVVGDDRWVTANFKETQLARMRPGQRVSVDVDSCPDRALSGTVLEIQPGSGSVFSALPAENATGNFVKVVQRVPVKIALDRVDPAQCRLSPGMSATPSVTVR